MAQIKSLEGMIGKGVSGMAGMGKELQERYAAIHDPNAGTLAADLKIHAATDNLLYVVEAGAENIMPYSCYVSMLGLTGPDIG